MVCKQSTEWNWFVRHGWPEAVLSYFWDHLVNASAYVFFPLHPLPACFLIWQGLAIGDWRENQIKATHQPIANRTENVSLMMGCVTRWKVSPWLCISEPCLGKNAKLPVLCKQTQLYKKYANWLLQQSVGLLWMESCSIPIPFASLLFSLCLSFSRDMITMGKIFWHDNAKICQAEPASTTILCQVVSRTVVFASQAVSCSLGFPLTLNSQPQWLWSTVYLLF